MTTSPSRLTSFPALSVRGASSENVAPKGHRARRDIPVEVRYRPYFLNPWVPREGMSRVDCLDQVRFSERYEKIALVCQAARTRPDLQHWCLARNRTALDCHRLILWAGGIGKAAQVKQRLMRFISRGGDLSDRDVLVQAASDCGLDPVEVRNLLASDADVAAVERAAKSAQEAGIDGVPFYVFGNVLAVSGAQAPDYLAGAIERAVNELAKSAA